MKQISAESISKALDKIDNMDDEALDKLIETFTLSQPQLVDYILQAGVEYENEDLNIYSIYYFAVLMECIIQNGSSIREVTEQDIEDFQEPFLMALDAINNEDFEPMQDLIQQHHMYSFVITEIEAEDEDGNELEDEMKSQLFIVCAGMIGLMHLALK